MSPQRTEPTDIQIFNIFLSEAVAFSEGEFGQKNGWTQDPTLRLLLSFQTHQTGHPPASEGLHFCNVCLNCKPKVALSGISIEFVPSREKEKVRRLSLAFREDSKIFALTVDCRKLNLTTEGLRCPSHNCDVSRLKVMVCLGAIHQKEKDQGKVIYLC